MKLLRLKLNVDFRSLVSGFEVNFLNDLDYDRRFEFHPYCLAGRNGSGKSNILEALAAIFYHIECTYLTYRPDGFEFDDETYKTGFMASKSTPDAFELEYYISNNTIEPIKHSLKSKYTFGAHIRISKVIGERPEIHWLNRADYEDTEETQLSRPEVKGFLPEYILGYSSGHNEILSLPFFKMRFIHFDEYRDRLTKDLDYDGKPEGRMIYLDDQFSQAILLCHFLFPSDAILRVFEEKIGLKGIRQFRLIIRKHHLLPVAEERLLSMTSDELNDTSKTRVELTSKFSGYRDENNQLQLGLIDKLIKCSTTNHEDYSAYSDDEGYDLILDYWMNEATKRAFEVHFGSSSGGTVDSSMAESALNLFQSFQTLLTLNYYEVDDITKAELYQSDSLYVNETIPMPASHNRIMRFKHFEIIKDDVKGKLYSKGLSDGEHQLLHTIGLCLLFRHTSALFLLDEPETHLNPEWRASYISTLRAALEAEEETKSVMREVLITSHSPFIISDCRKENVLIFKKNEKGIVEWSPPEFQTFGASANAITIKVFDQKTTIGNYALSKLETLKQRLNNGERPDVLIDEAGKELGDSVEKVLFINQALDKLEGM